MKVSGQIGMVSYSPSFPSLTLDIAPPGLLVRQLAKRLRRFSSTNRLPNIHRVDYTRFEGVHDVFNGE